MSSGYFLQFEVLGRDLRVVSPYLTLQPRADDLHHYLASPGHDVYHFEIDSDNIRPRMEEGDRDLNQEPLQVLAKTQHGYRQKILEDREVVAIITSTALKKNGLLDYVFSR